jgi:exosortase
MEFSPATANPAGAAIIDVRLRQVGTLSVMLGLLALALCWLLVFNALRIDWATNPQYSYGWFVPFLALGLLRFRWSSRPDPKPAARKRLLLASLGAVLSLLLPILLIEEANPEWRLAQWFHATQMVLATLLWLYYAGGRPWVRHFAFVVGFLLVAVPWPMPLEIFLVQNLMRVVAAVTVEAVGLINIPAVQHGNIIQISSGLVGVDEACSGVRSLQTAFFVCLFLGELYRFSWSRRALLLVLGFLAALVCNVGRTFFLVSSAAKHGLENMHSVHDLAGDAVLVITLLLIAGLAHLLKPRGNPSPPVTTPRTTARALPTGAAVALLVWVVVAEAANEIWYRLHETQSVENAHWTAVWPGGPEKAQSVPLDSTVVAMLRCNEGKSGLWPDDIGNQWQAFFLRWAPGRNSAQLASAHTPEICLRGVGYQLTSDLGIQTLSFQDLQLPFHQYIFGKEHAQLHVFYCRWEDKRSTEPQAPLLREDNSHWSRILAVLAGRRHRGQQVLEITLKGPDTSQEAWDALAHELPRIIRR